MTPTPDRLQQFMQIYKKEYEEDVTEDEAREYIARLMRLYEVAARPLPREEVPESNLR
jgi:hypothetical protein